jgi:mRNA interferase MazF
MTRGEIHLANFPFGDAAGMKLRPVLLLTAPVGPVPDVLVAYISSVVPPKLLDSDIVLDASTPQASGTNLKVTSILRLHKLATIHRRSIARRLGSIPAATAADAQQKLRRLLNL